MAHTSLQLLKDKKMINFIWKINNIRYEPNDGGVFFAEWECTANDETQKISTTGYVDFHPDPSNESFIQLNDLTEEQVLSWVWELNQIPKDEIETSLSSYLENNQAPTKKPTLPWNTAEEIADSDGEVIVVDSDGLVE